MTDFAEFKRQWAKLTDDNAMHFRKVRFTDVAVAVAAELGRGDAPLCTACQTYHDPEMSDHDRKAECLANRPKCHVPNCRDEHGRPRVTCIQAMANKRLPMCLDHFFCGVPEMVILCP